MRRMRALFLSYGAAGDVFPFLAVARALIARGHHVVMISDRTYEERVRMIGAEFRSLGDRPLPPSARVERALTRPTASVAYLKHIVIPRIPKTLAIVSEAIAEDRPDVMLVHHAAGLGVPWIARRLGVRWAMAAVAPASWTSVQQYNVYPGMPDLDRYPPGMIRLGVVIGSRFMCAALDPAINRARIQMGLPKRGRFLFDEMFEGDANLGLWSPVFRPEASDDKPRSVVCGFARGGVAAAVDLRDEELERFLDAGEPPVLFTLGTSVPHATEKFFKGAREACRQLGVRGLFLTGRAERVKEENAGIMVRSFVPIDAVIGRCAAAVHHAGLGTIAACLISARPMVSIPFMHDQFDNASRCRRLGVSLTIDRRRMTGTALREAIERVLGNDGIRAACLNVAARTKDEDGASNAARVLEDVLART